MPADAMTRSRGCKRGAWTWSRGGWNVELELATPAHREYFREPASCVNKQLNQGTMMMDKLRLNDWPCGD